MRKLLSALAVAGLAAGAAFGFSPTASQATEAMIYKNPGCECCEGYADYLRQNGFTVTVQPSHDMSAMGREAGIPDDFQGCHLAFIDDYVVSGHVPIATVTKLLTERPDIKGVTLPGMPMGSPGMAGAKTGPFEILEIPRTGAISRTYASE